MSGKRNVSVCRGHELANALYGLLKKMGVAEEVFLSNLAKLALFFYYSKRNETKPFALGKGGFVSLIKDGR